MKYMRKSKTTESKYPEDDRNLEVYNDWEAGREHYDFKNNKKYDNRSVALNLYKHLKL